MTDPIIAENWNRYQYGCQRGHDDYIKRARKCEQFYLGEGGGGEGQWSPEDRMALESSGRLPIEINKISSPIDAAIGYQIGNRADIGFRPRGGSADQETASTLSKLAMQIADNNKLHNHETTVFSDGVIQQRGYFEIRMSYDDTILGEVSIDTLDPLDVIPDPDAKSYDPDGWGDVIIRRWLTTEEIETVYGTKTANSLPDEPGDVLDHGTTDEDRNSFGHGNTLRNSSSDQNDIKRYLIIDRQAWKIDRAECIITSSGDIRVIEGMSDQAVAAMLADGGIKQKRRVRRIKWTVTTEDQVLHDDWSPFRHFTVVPYFPKFRRGKTRGLVDNSIGPQQMLNKSMSQGLHVINTSANSGWITVAGTLTNMSDSDLADRGAETGLHLMVKAGTKVEDRPQKIQPNPFPPGFAQTIQLSSEFLATATGVNEAMMGAQGDEISGIAIQTRQFAAQQTLALPLDNLAYTRSLLAGRMLEMIQAFYDQPRIMRITETDANGDDNTTEIQLNWPQADARILNDLTIGEYDVVVTEAPAQITFENSQFLQALELNEKGANIPWSFIIQYSNLANKKEIVDAMSQQPAAPVDPTLQAKADLLAAQAQKAQADAGRSQVDAAKSQASLDLLKAQTDDTRADTVAKSITAQFSAVQTAATIAQTPAVASLADALLLSGGYVDHNAAPIVPEYTGTVMAAPDLPKNTNPLTPASPAVGMDAGIETPRIEGAPES